MKKILLSVILTYLACSTPALAWSDDICDTRLFKQMVKSEKQGIQRPKITPTKKLANLMDEYEVLCPLQIEKDFNEDGLLDWFGIINKNKRNYLVIYVSKRTIYQLLEIKELKFQPNNLYFDTMRLDYFEVKAGAIFSNIDAKFVAMENNLNGVSTGYGWNGKTMEKLAEYKRD